MKKLTLKSIRTITILGKDWFDRINGNTYCSSRVVINQGSKTERLLVVPFQYGYGTAFRQYALEAVAREIGSTYAEVADHFAGTGKVRHHLSNTSASEARAWGDSSKVAAGH